MVDNRHQVFSDDGGISRLIRKIRHLFEIC